MAENNSVNDSYNPPGIGTDFEEFNFEDIEIDDLIWLDNNTIDGMKNPAHRKINETRVQNLQTGQSININNRQKVYQKT
tara:strand:- start:543 stop:779 length:237 start_codon:yes stop_codon:yes gene_type:complete